MKRKINGAGNGNDLRKQSVAVVHVGVSMRLDSNIPPQAVERPNLEAKCFTLVEGSAFVKASASISSVGQYES